MSDEKRLKARVAHKHKKESEWKLDVYTEDGELRIDPFIPMNGELIIFDPKEEGGQRRFKFGDDVTNVMELPFAISENIKDGDAENSIVLNDTENNKVLTAYSTAAGYNTAAGCLLFEIKEVNVEEETYTLSDILDAQYVGEEVTLTFTANYGKFTTIAEIIPTTIEVVNQETNETSTKNVSKVKLAQFTDGENKWYDQGAGIRGYLKLVNFVDVGDIYFGTAATALGYQTKATGIGSIAVGAGSNAEGKYSSAFGRNTYASYSSHAEGHTTVASGSTSHAEGYQSNAKGNYSHVEGAYVNALSHTDHAEGFRTMAGNSEVPVATPHSAHAEGYQTTAKGTASHAEGRSSNRYPAITTIDEETPDNIKAAWMATKFSLAYGSGSHIEGSNALALSDYSHAEGNNTIASGMIAHAEGNGTTAAGAVSHAEGQNTTAYNETTHAEGFNTVAGDENDTTTRYHCAHAEGHSTVASGQASHAEGMRAHATNTGAHAEGLDTRASGLASHAGGRGTKATAEAQTALGSYNKEDNNALLIVGNGTGDAENQRENAFTVNKNGTATVQTNPIEEKDVATKKYIDDKATEIQTAAEKVATDYNTAMDTRVKTLEEIDYDNYVTSEDVSNILAPTINSVTGKINSMEEYAETQNMIQTTVNTWHTRKTANGLNIVDGLKTQLKSIAYPENRTDGALCYIQGIRSTSANLLEVSESKIAYELKKEGADIEYTIDEESGAIVLTGTNVDGIDSYQMRFNITLEPGKYYLSGCPRQGNASYVLSVVQSGKTVASESSISGYSSIGFVVEQTGTYSVRCTVNKGSVANCTFYPRITRYETIYWLHEKDHNFYELAPNGKLDIENNSDQFGTGLYQVWENGVETILSDSEFTVSQSYYIDKELPVMQYKKDGNEITSITNIRFELNGSSLNIIINE